PLVGLHYFEAGEWRKAAGYLAEGGRATRRLFALREEGEDWERVLAALDQLPGPDPALYFAAVDQWVFGRVGLDEMDGLVGPEPDRAASPWFVRAERMARESGDKAKLARLLSWIANVYMRVGRGSKGADQLRESGRLAEELGDERLMMLPLFIS